MCHLLAELVKQDLSKTLITRTDEELIIGDLIDLNQVGNLLEIWIVSSNDSSIFMMLL